MKFVASRLHKKFVSVYDVMMVYQVPGYPDYDVLWQSRYLVLEGPNLWVDICEQALLLYWVFSRHQNMIDNKKKHYKFSNSLGVIGIS